LTAAWVKDNKDSYDELARLQKIQEESDEAEEALRDRRRAEGRRRHDEEVAEFLALQELVDTAFEKTNEDFADEELKLELKQKEFEFEEGLAWLRLNGFELDAARLEIQERKLGPMQEELALKELQAGADAKLFAQAEKARKKRDRAAYVERKNEEDAAKRKNALLTRQANLAKSLVGAAGALADEEEAASRFQAAIDGGIYAYKAIAAGATGNFFSAAEFAAASVAAFALAGRSSSSSESASSGATAAADPGRATTQAASEGGTSARTTFGSGSSGDTNLTVNYSSTVAPGPEQARDVADLTAQDLSERI